MVGDEREGKVSEYIYLQGSLVAIRERDVPTGVYTTKYQHTDALGSPAAVTDQSRSPLERTYYEPYGLPDRPWRDGPGYTGHVEDAATQLAYMQQRYYDPMLGKMLSVDPVTAYSSGDMRHFNPYAYAFNNPYKFTDPDGRNPLGAIVGMVVEVGYQMGVEGKSLSEIDKSDVVVAGLIGMVAPGTASAMLRAGKTGAQVARNTRAVRRLGDQSARTPNRAAKLEQRINRNVEEASEAVLDAAATAGAAAGGVVAKNLIQDAVNHQQGQGQQGQQGQEKQEAPKPEPPPPPKEELKR